MRIIALSLAAVCAFALANNSQAADVASDNAGNTVYDNDWQTGYNGGIGFSAWTITTEGTSNESGAFVGSSTVNGDGNGGIDTAGRALGLYANSGRTSSALRSFTGGALLTGQTFSLSIDNGFIESGNAVGMALQNSSGQNLVEFFFFGGSSNYTVNAASATGSTPGFTDEGLNLTFTIGAAGSFALTIDPLDAQSTQIVTGTLSNATGGQVASQFRLFNANAGGGDARNFYANSFAVSAVPEPLATLGGSALLGLLALRRR